MYKEITVEQFFDSLNERDEHIGDKLRPITDLMIDNDVPRDTPVYRPTKTLRNEVKNMLNTMSQKALCKKYGCTKHMIQEIAYHNRMTKRTAKALSNYFDCDWKELVIIID